jgi:hypothetical protein
MTAAAGSDAVQAHLRTLAVLAAVEREARAARSVRELAFLLVNRVRAVLPHDLAVYWPAGGTTAPLAVSGVSAPDPGAPTVLWLRRLRRSLPDRPPPGLEVGETPPDEGPPPGFETATRLLVLNLGQDGETAGHVAFLRAAPWTDTDRALAERLGDVFGHALWALTRRSRASSGRARLSRRALWIAGLALLAGGLAFPVRLSVVAPAEVVPEHPVVVGAPVAGVIRDILVEPNQTVRDGDPLFRLDPREAAARVTVAEGALAMAEAELLRLRQSAFRDPQGAAAVRLAETERARRQADLAYARDRLARTEVRAPAAGVVLFNDPNDWLGRPVDLGRRVMTVADPAAVELSVSLPVDDAVAVAEGQAVAFHLNIAPMRAIPAEITHIGYEPLLVEETGLLAYRLRARFTAPDAAPRVGLRGTARLAGERRPLLVHILRRPVAAVRRILPF